jgi:DNA-binding GntR family transcriptional regulator
MRRADLIAEKIETMILTGEVDVGERLDEGRLAALFGVSRTPVREALLSLTATGLAEHRPRRGVFVLRPTAAELLDLFEVMAGLEAMCGSLAARRIGSEALAWLRGSVLRSSEAAEAADADGYYHENEAFHFRIYRETGNAFLARETGRLHRRLRPFRRTQLQLRGRLEQSLAEHVGIVDALEAGDAAAASARLGAHVAVQGEKFHLLVRDIGAS